MANFIPDDIDFSTYMNLTEHDQRVIASGSYKQDVIDYFWSEKQNRGQTMPWEVMQDKIRFRPSEVTLWSGMNGHGKSMALGQVVIGLMQQERKTCIASFEMLPHVTLARMCRQAHGTNKPTPDQISEFHGTTDSWIWMYDQQGMVTADKMIGVMNYCATVKNIEHFVIDSFLKCGIGEEDMDGQKRFIDRICTVARDTGMHIHLVAHSRKKEDESKAPRKMDIKGSGAIADQVDNVLIWWRNKPKEEALHSERDRRKIEDWLDQPDAMMICDKQRNGDWEGKAGFWFDAASLQFLERAGMCASSMLRKSKF